MNEAIKSKIIQICTDKIDKKGPNVGLSFYAFFENKNTDPTLLLEVAKWWIMEHKFDHFEKAIKIKTIVENLK
jgi:mannitol-1-phosphate/altronate dehydrogenase